MPKKMFVCTLLMGGLSMLCFSPAQAATDAAPQAQPSPLKPQLKGLLDRSGNWLIEQYDVKTKCFKKKETYDAVLGSMAIYITTLHEHRRRYCEASGPFISDPVELLSKVTEDVENNKLLSESFLYAQALESTKNEKYKPLIEKLKAKATAPVAIEIKMLEQLSALELKPETLLGTLTTIRALVKDGKKEITIDGKAVNWAETLTAGLLKKEQKGGFFTGEVRTDALVLQLLSLCYKQL